MPAPTYAKACLDEGINRASVLKNTCEMISMAVGAEYVVNPEWTTSGLYVAGEAAMLSNQVRGMIDSDVLGLSYILSDQMDAVQGIPGANQIASAIADAEWLCANFRERAETLYEAYCRMNDRAGFMEETETNTFLKWYLGRSFQGALFRDVVTGLGSITASGSLAAKMFEDVTSMRFVESLKSAGVYDYPIFDRENRLISKWLPKQNPITREEIIAYKETGELPKGHGKRTMERAVAVMEAEAARSTGLRVSTMIRDVTRPFKVVGGIVLVVTVGFDGLVSGRQRYEDTLALGYNEEEALRRGITDGAISMGLDIVSVLAGKGVGMLVETGLAGSLDSPLAPLAPLAPVLVPLSEVGTTVLFDFVAVPVIKELLFEQVLDWES